MYRKTHRRRRRLFKAKEGLFKARWREVVCGEKNLSMGFYLSVQR
jgi:hypothetical protein